MSASPEEPHRTTPRAVAMRYDPRTPAPPNLVAKGRGDVALRIMELAERHDVPIRRDPDMVELLAACELGDEIPLELYAAVAELLAYLYGLNAERSAA